MGTMFQAIAEKKQDFITNNRSSPSKVCPGRQEIKQLLKEAEDLGYGKQFPNATIEGFTRPEVWGLLVYVVNTDGFFLEVL